MWRNVSNIAGKAIRINGNKTYYFNSNGVYCVIPTKEAIARRMPGITVYHDGSVRLFRWYNYDSEFNGVNCNILIMAIARLEPGDTIDDLYHYIDTVKPVKRALPEGLDRFITKIIGPSIEREVGNKNTKTFDFIYMDVCIVNSWETDKREYIKQNLKEIKRRVIEKIENSKRFQRFGIPVNVLKITSITLTRDDVLHFIFELKMK